ncbi:MAG TPA: zinc ribbon domain-containing protein [Nitrososphaerales archaeon]|nr:zinc ribbon domain-containing protein [Nitrososphaerales archaeon]
MGYPLQQTTTRTPVVSAFFNFASWGTGYAYAGIVNPYGVPWIIGTIALVIYCIGYGIVFLTVGIVYPNPATITNPFSYTSYFPHINWAALILYGVPGFGISVFLGYDVYRKASSSTGVTNLPNQARRCSNCSAYVSPADDFCQECGHRVGSLQQFGVAPPGSATLSSKRCENCGTYNPDAYVFCQRCGLKM